MHKTVFILSVFLFGLSCKKENSNGSLLQKWKVDSFVEHSDSIARNADNDVFIEFKSDKTITIELNVNNCSGTFSKPDGSELTIEGIFCTEACCDSDFSTRLIKLLPLINSYHFVNDQLNLNGEENRSIRLLKTQ